MILHVASLFEVQKKIRNTIVFAFQCANLFYREFVLYSCCKEGNQMIGLDQEKALVLLEGIYSTVIMRDILERENRRGGKQITDPVLLKKNRDVPCR